MDKLDWLVTGCECLKYNTVCILLKQIMPMDLAHKIIDYLLEDVNDTLVKLIVYGSHGERHKMHNVQYLSVQLPNLNAIEFHITDAVLSHSYCADILFPQTHRRRVSIRIKKVSPYIISFIQKFDLRSIHELQQHSKSKEFFSACLNDMNYDLKLQIELDTTCITVFDKNGNANLQDVEAKLLHFKKNNRIDAKVMLPCLFVHNRFTGYTLKTKEIIVYDNTL